MKNTIILILFSFFILNNINAQSYYKKDGKFGALTSDGSILTEAKYDTVYMPNFAYDKEYLITKKNNKYGIITFPTDTKPIIIEPKFDAIFGQDYNYIVILKQGNKYGFICHAEKYEAGSPSRTYWIKNFYISEIKYDSIVDSYLYIDNKVGFLFKGYMKYGDRLIIYSFGEILAIYDTIARYYGCNKKEKIIENNKSFNPQDYPFIKVVKDGFVNYLTVSYKDSITFHPLFSKNTYTADEINYIEDTQGFIINQIGKPLLIFQPNDSTYKTIIDDLGNPIILDKYYLFSYKEKTNVYPNRHDVHFYIGVKGKEMINIFIDAKNNQHSIVFKDSIFDKSIFDKQIDYEKITVEVNNPNKVEFMDSDPFYIPKTVFIAKYTRFKTENVYKMEVALISYPDKKVFYTTILNDENEKLVFDRIDYPQDDWTCPYFKIVKEIKTSSNDTKHKTLGYINLKTCKFSEKKPNEEGCKDLKYRM